MTGIALCPRCEHPVLEWEAVNENGSHEEYIACFKCGWHPGSDVEEEDDLFDPWAAQTDLADYLLAEFSESLSETEAEEIAETVFEWWEHYEQ